MGRLENFIPQIKKLRFEDQKNHWLVTAEGHVPLVIDGALLPFLKQINGHLSLREIFLFLNKKNQRVSVSKSLETLVQFAEKGYLQNGEAFLKIYKQREEIQAKRGNHSFNQLNHSYFSQERLIGLLQKTTLFMKCDRDVAHKILKHSKLENVQENIRIIKDGTKSRHFYILLAGEVGVFKKGQCLATLSSLSIFGESAAIFDRERNADVQTTSPCWLLRIDASQLVDRTSPESFDVFNGLRSRLILNQTLASNPLFKNMPSDILQLFLSKCRIEKHAKESIIIKQGETTGDFYFILKGSVAIVKNQMPVTSLGEGEHFGEIAAIFNQSRTASVITETECVFLSLSSQALFEVLSSHFRLAIDIEKTAEARRESEDNIFTKMETSGAKEISFMDEETKSFTGSLEIDENFLETTQTNFDIEVFDFSKLGKNGDKAS